MFFVRKPSLFVQILKFPYILSKKSFIFCPNSGKTCFRCSKPGILFEIHVFLSQNIVFLEKSSNFHIVYQILLLFCVQIQPAWETCLANLPCKLACQRKFGKLWACSFCRGCLPAASRLPGRLPAGCPPSASFWNPPRLCIKNRVGLPKRTSLGISPKSEGAHIHVYRRHIQKASNTIDNR